MSSARRGRKSLSYPSLAGLVAKKEHSKKTDGEIGFAASGTNLVANLLGLFNASAPGEANNSCACTGETGGGTRAMPAKQPHKRGRATTSFALLFFVLFIAASTLLTPFSISRRRRLPLPELSLGPDIFQSDSHVTDRSMKGAQTSTELTDLVRDAGSLSVRDAGGMRVVSTEGRNGWPLTRTGTLFPWLWGPGYVGTGETRRSAVVAKGGGGVQKLVGVSRLRRLRAAVVVCKQKLVECQDTLQVCEEAEQDAKTRSSDKKRVKILRTGAQCDAKARKECQSLAALCSEAHRSLKEQQGEEGKVALHADEEEEDGGPADFEGDADCTPFITTSTRRKCLCPTLYHGGRACTLRESRGSRVSFVPKELLPLPYGGDFLLTLDSLKRAQKETGEIKLKVYLPEKPEPLRTVWEIGPDGSKQSSLPSLLAQHDPLKGRVFQSCAVVGSSGLLLMETKGQEIDQHSAVFRFNGAPTFGFEKYVGSKTTFRFVNSKWYKFRERPEETIIFQSRSASHFSKYIDFLLSPEHLAEPFYLMDPEFTTFLAASAHNMTAALLRRRKKTPVPNEEAEAAASSDAIPETLAPGSEFIPTSGWIGLMMAIQMCRKVVMYGFQVSESHGVPYHYHNQCPQPHVDRDNLEFHLVNAIVNAKIAAFGDPCVAVCHESRRRCTNCMERHISPRQRIQGMGLWGSLSTPDYCFKQQEGGGADFVERVQKSPAITLPDWMETGLPAS